MAAATPQPRPTKRIKMRIRKGDTVKVIAGKDKGKPVKSCAPFLTRTVWWCRESTCAPVT